MKIGWIAAVGLALAVGALLLLRGGADSDATRPGAAAARLAGSPSGGAGNGEPGAGERGTGMTSRPGFPGQRRDAAGGTDGGAPGSGGDRLARLAGGGANRGPAGGSGDSRPGFGRATLPRAGTADVTRREVPAAGSAGTQEHMDFGNVDPAGEPVPDVVYDAGTDKTFPTDSQAEVTDAAKISGAAGTISFWLKPEWADGNQEDATIVQLGDSGMEITKNVNFLRFQFHDSDGGENGLGTNLATWPANQWRQVTATWADNQFTLYVDGKMVSQNRFARLPEFQDETKLYVGSAFASGAPAARATIGQLLVLNRDSSAGEIGTQFHNGPPGSKPK
ncbi:MAG: LamG-like jellyroll fold domain-containing protein [bacterium]